MAALGDKTIQLRCSKQLCTHFEENLILESPDHVCLMVYSFFFLHFIYSKGTKADRALIVFVFVLCHSRLCHVLTQPCLRERRFGIPGLHAPHVRKQLPRQPAPCAAKDSRKLQPARFWCLWDTGQVRNAQVPDTWQQALFPAPQQPSHIPPHFSCPAPSHQKPQRTEPNIWFAIDETQESQLLFVVGLVVRVHFRDEPM